MRIVIDISKNIYECVKKTIISDEIFDELVDAFRNGQPLPKGHGRLGDLDELEQRISNFVERDARITDEYTVVKQRFIVDGIRDTPTIIEADTESEDKR